MLQRLLRRGVEGPFSTVTAFRKERGNEPSQANSEEETGSSSLYESLSILFHKSCMQAEHLGRILYFGPPLLKVLASSCLVEIFYDLTVRVQKQYLQKSDAIAQLSSTLLQSLVMVIQGCLFDSNVSLQRNAAYCLHVLIRSTGLSNCEQKAVKGSCWYRIVLEELLLSLATQHPTSESCVSSSYLSYVAVALLAVSPPLDWLQTIFHPVAITAVISSLSYAAISLDTFFLFKELLRAGYLEADHIKKLQDIFQCARKVMYNRRSEGLTIDYILEKDRRVLCGSSCKRHSDTMCLQSDESVISLVVSWSLDPCTGLRQYTSNEADLYVSAAFVASIDEFLQESSSYEID